MAPATLGKVRAAARAGAPAVAEAMAQLRADAAKALKAGPFTVMAKTQVRPSGDKHDYMSLARYYYPVMVAAALHYPDLSLEALADTLAGPSARGNRTNIRVDRGIETST